MPVAQHLNPVRVLQLVEDTLPDNSILVVDGGDFVGTAALLPVAAKKNQSSSSTCTSATNSCPGEALKEKGAFASNPKSNPLQTYSPVVGSGARCFAYRL